MKKIIKNWGLLLLLACIWGSSFILMKKGMFTSDMKSIFSSNQVGSLRMLIASITLLPFSIQAMRNLQKKKDLIYFCIVGICGNFIPAFLFTYAETQLSSGIAGIMNSFTPLFTLLVGVLFFAQKITLYQVFGTVIGFVGISALILSGGQTNMSGLQNFFPSLAIVLATFMYGISLNTIKHKLPAYKPIHVAAGGFLMVLLPSIISFFMFDTYATFQSNPFVYGGFTAIVLLAVIGTAFAVFLFNGIIQQTSALFASNVTYLIPIFAVLIGLSFRETIHSTQVFSMIIVLSGVILANYGHVIFSKRKNKVENV